MDTVVARAVELGARMNGHPDRAPACVAELSEMLTDATATSTTAHIVMALGHGWTDVACRAVLSQAGHPATEVRLAVAQSLHFPDEPALKSAVVDALKQLCADSSGDVREWATFTLGSNADIDSTDIRSVLADRLDDPVAEVREEALKGLARRHDSRAVEAVRAGLGSDQTGVATFEAAHLLADPSLFSLLVEWSTNRPDDEEIQAAAMACDPVKQQRRRQLHDDLLAAVQLALDQRSPGQIAAMFCGRLDDEVLLSCDDGDHTWLVDALLHRAGDDVQTTAVLVVNDQATGTARGVGADHDNKIGRQSRRCPF